MLFQQAVILDSYAGTVSIPCAGFTFMSAANGTVSFNTTRVFALTANQSIYFLMSVSFSSKTLAANGISGMADTRIG